MSEFFLFLTFVSVFVSILVLFLLVYFLICVPKHLESIVRIMRLIAYTGIPEYSFESDDDDEIVDDFENNT